MAGIALAHVKSGEPGVDSDVAKLPIEIDPAAVNNATYKYTDAKELLKDIQRLRRKTGWVVSWLPDKKNFIFYVIGYDPDNADNDKFVHFQINPKAVQQNFWPSLHPEDPKVPELRRWFFEKGGPEKIAAYLNETPKEESSEGRSVWDRLRDDDIF